MSKERIARTCQTCNNPFTVRPCDIKKNPCIFCSVDCRMKSQITERQTIANNPQTLLNRFEAKFQKDETGCWIWQAQRDKQGYGRIRVKGKSMPAHRISYRIYKNIEPGTQLVRHSCDIPSCVNPDHLLLGSNQDNRNDCTSKKRHVFGQQVHTCKLTPDQVLAIRSDNRLQKEIAAEYGINQTHVSRIKRQITWKILT